MSSTDPTTDAELMTRFYDGDTAAVGELFARYRGRLIGYFRKKGLDAAAEDRAQEVLLQVLDSRAGGRRYDPGQPFATWLFTLAYYQFLSAWQERRRYAGTPVGEGPGEVDVPAGDDGPAEQFWRGVERATVQACACRLGDERLRQVVEGWLATEGGQKLRELAGEMGVSVTGAHDLRGRAFEAMRQCLEAEGA